MPNSGSEEDKKDENDEKHDCRNDQEHKPVTKTRLVKNNILMGCVFRNTGLETEVEMRPYLSI